MSKLNFLLLAIFTAFVLSSCLDSSTNAPTTREMVTFENYYVNNQSNLELNLIYKLKTTGKDNTISIPADTTTLIFESGSVRGGSNPYTRFKKLSFYKISSDTSTPILTIEPARRPNLSDRWTLTTGNNDNPAKFVLTITNGDLQ